MKKIQIPRTKNISRNESKEGITLEETLRRNKQGAGIELQGTKPLLYTVRKDGVIPEANIKTDKFEMAQIAHDTIARLKEVKRNEFDKKIAETETAKSQNESTQGTNGDAKS